MRSILAIFTVILFSFSALAQGDGLEWHTDLMKVNEISQKTGKPIFGFFTGSDWCGWCHKLEHDVFAKPAFIKWAKENVVLLELDFPRRKQLPPELVQQNNSLQQAFQVQGYPTIWYFSVTPDPATGKMNINAYGNQGYPAGAPNGREDEVFLASANDILAKAKADLSNKKAATQPASTTAKTSSTTKAKTKKK